MTLGIIPNISKANILQIVLEIIEQLRLFSYNYIICDSLLKVEEIDKSGLNEAEFFPIDDLIKRSDMVISIGGDGTMLTTAYEVRKTSTPIIGVNFGKLGFLAEFDISSFKDLLKEISNKNYVIDERMTLVGGNISNGTNELYAINDIVVEKAPYPKMIDLTIKVDEDYVATFSADGIIIATPTGSTGYSLSTGGPIVNPGADVITISPIAPHSLTMRPLVVSSKQKITVMVKSHFGKIQVSCDGQRSYIYNSPTSILVKKSKQSVRLVHSNKTNYFETLRNKLYWGLDVRKGNS